MKKPYLNQYQRMHIRIESGTGGLLSFHLAFKHVQREIVRAFNLLIKKK